MVGTGNVRNKRKNDASNTDVKIEPAMKALKKNDIILQFQVLQQKYEALEKQNDALLKEQKTHIESILLLEETVKVLEKKSARVEKKSVEVQTEIIRCEECEFPADDMNDLVYHMYEFHPIEDNEIGIKCYYCSNKFITKSELMMHRKQFHDEKVRVCNGFSDGKCVFGDDCWYSHNPDNEVLLEDYTCNICDNIFKDKSEYMHHRKKEHKEKVLNCKHGNNGGCHFGHGKCWFIHNDIQNIEETKEKENTNEIMQKLVEMFERQTEKILLLENTMNSRNLIK